jgi:hypothetical protein
MLGGHGMLTKNLETSISCSGSMSVFILPHEPLIDGVPFQIDHRHPEARKDLLDWGAWVLKVNMLRFHPWSASS